jgi:hypothetical protein
MEVSLQVRCQSCGKVYAQAGWENGRSQIEILEGISVEGVNREEQRAMMICSCRARTPIDLRLFEDVPQIEPGEPGWQPPSFD